MPNLNYQDTLSVGSDEEIITLARKLIPVLLEQNNRFRTALYDAASVSATSFDEETDTLVQEVISTALGDEKTSTV